MLVPESEERCFEWSASKTAGWEWQSVS